MSGAVSYWTCDVGAPVIGGGPGHRRLPGTYGCKPPSNDTSTPPVTKTVNLPANAIVTDVERLFWRAWNEQVKGIIVFRYGCRPTRVLDLGIDEQDAGVHVDGAYTGGCIGSVCNF